MSKRVFLILTVLIVGFTHRALAYDFSAVVPSGQTLYFDIINGGVEIVQPTSLYWGLTKPSGNLVIPDSVTYDGTAYCVISIDSFAFQYCRELTSVIIPNTVTKMEAYCFFTCSGLASVSIPNSVTVIETGTFNGTAIDSITIPNSVTRIEDGVFMSDTTLVYVVIPNSVTYIGATVFWNCTNLVFVSLGNSVDSIGREAFRKCYSLTNVTLPNSLTYLGYGAFYEDTSLTSIVFPETLSHIYRNTLRQCYNLQSVSLPDSLAVIDTMAFNSCRSLTALAFPQSMEQIKKGAFSDCIGLTMMTFYNDTPPLFGTDVFEGADTSVQVFVPCGTALLYAAVLQNFPNITEWFYSFSAVSDDEEMGTVEAINEPDCNNSVAELIATANEGYRFDHWSTGSVENPYSVTVESDTVIVAYFVQIPMYTISVEVNDTTMGSVDGGGEYVEGSVVVLTAEPKPGYEFAMWNDSITDNPRSITVTGNATYTAMFRQIVGIDNIVSDNIAVYSCDGCIVVDGAEGEPVSVFDITGRLLCSVMSGTVRYVVSSSGVYLVKIGDRPARKVVVRK